MRPMTINRNEWRPRRPDPEHRKCGRCRRTFYAGTLPPDGPVRSGPFAGTYLCRDCRESLGKATNPANRPLF